MQDDFMHNDKTNEQDQDDPQIRALLKDYPMPQADTGFYDQALARATHVGSRRQRNRWLMTGFGSAVAAGVAESISHGGISQGWRTHWIYQRVVARPANVLGGGARHGVSA
ncbi:MAG: hypothetical protein IIA12_00710 [Proteobacteria bacterium]|nr:hypothetical protein [Pseudomonadota bacterium]